MTIPGFVNIGGKKIRAFFDDDRKPIEVYDKDIKSYVDYRSYIERSNKPNIEVLATNKEGRNICGKIRTCKISGDKIVEVYDDEKKIYVPHDEFLRQHEGYKTNPIVDDTTEEYKNAHKEYYTTRGKKARILEEDKKVKEDNESMQNKKPDNKVIPMNTATTILSTSGTAGTVTIPDNIKVNVNIREEKGEKREEKEEKRSINPYKRYVNKVLRRK